MSGVKWYKRAYLQCGVKGWKSVFVTNLIHTSKQVSLPTDVAVIRVTMALQVTKRGFPKVDPIRTCVVLASPQQVFANELWL